MSRRKRKPTGTRGPIHVHGSLKDGVTVEHERIVFPDSKTEVEQFIVTAFVSAAVRAGKLPTPFVDIRPRPENDFDFVDVGAVRPTYLELMEIAPLEKVNGSYDGAPSSYRSYDFAEVMLGKVLGKSERYSPGKDTRLVLLLYVTDWRFNPSGTVIALLQYWMLTKPHVFSEVYAFCPSSSDDGIVYLIYPTPAAFWRDFDPEAHRSNETFNVDPQGWNVSTGPDG